jgi:hypothetical protein
MEWLGVTCSAVALVVALALAAFSTADTRWSRTSMRIHREIIEGVVSPSAMDAAPPPAPVARFLARALPIHAPSTIWVRLEQEGSFRTGEGEDGWKPFTASQIMRLHPPAFLWDARIAMAPLVTVRVRDSYLDGQGGMTARIGGLIPVMNAPPTPELAKAALERYLAEAAWIPERLVPGNGLFWSAVDDTTAVVTLTDGDVAASVTVTFSPDSDIVGVYVPDRNREVDGDFVPTPWVGRFWDHGPGPGAYRVPRQAEVAWVVEGDTLPYWRGRLVWPTPQASR